MANTVAADESKPCNQVSGFIKVYQGISQIDKVLEQMRSDFIFDDYTTRIAIKNLEDGDFYADDFLYETFFRSSEDQLTLDFQIKNLAKSSKEMLIKSKDNCHSAEVLSVFAGILEEIELPASFIPGKILNLIENEREEVAILEYKKTQQYQRLKLNLSSQVQSIRSKMNEVKAHLEELEMARFLED